MAARWELLNSIYEEAQTRKLPSSLGKYCKNLRRATLPGWKVIVYYGDLTENEGPLDVKKCMSCDLDCPLTLGITGSGSQGPTSADTLLFSADGMRCWLDAKSRPMFVVTPILHEERMSALTDADLVSLWRVAVATLDKFNLNTFQSMILNHGSNRNHAHLHLKIRIPNRTFAVSSANWDAEVQKKLERLQEFASSLPVSGKRPYQPPTTG